MSDNFGRLAVCLLFNTCGTTPKQLWDADASCLEVQIFVDPKDANNVPARLKERMEKEVQDKGNML